MSFTGNLSLVNYENAWAQAEIPKYFINTVDHRRAGGRHRAVPGLDDGVRDVALQLAVQRHLVAAVHGGQPAPATGHHQSALPDVPRPAAAAVPERQRVFYNQYFGIMAIHVAFQLGFCTFVLSNYMKTLPHRAERGSLRRRRVGLADVLADHAAAHAAGTRRTGDPAGDLDVQRLLLGDRADEGRRKRFPITSSLNNLKGQFFTDNNLVAAGAIMVALPTLIVFFVLQKQFVRGLTLGSTKG